MTSKQAKALIGKAIKYAKRHTSHVYWHYATVLAVEGKNLLIDKMGMTDWLWLPDVHIVPIAPETAPSSQTDA